MAKGDIWLQRFWEGTSTTTTDAPNLLSPFSRTFNEGRIELSRKDRTANARLVIDIINTKRKFSLDYKMISNADLDELISYYDSQIDSGMYLELTIQYTDIRIETYRVLMSPIDMERLLVTGDGMWTGVTIEFEEL